MFPLFATGVVYTGGKFAVHVVGTRGNLPMALLTPVANLLPVSLTPVANLPLKSTTLVKLVAKFAAGSIDTGGNFATGVFDTGNLPPVSLIPVVHLDLRISPRLFKKFKTVLMGYSGAGEKLIHEKTRSIKSCDTVPLNRITSQNKRHLHSRLPDLLLSLWYTGGVVQAYQEIGI